MPEPTKSVRLPNALYVEAEGLLARHNDEDQDFQLPELLAQLKPTSQDVCRLAMAKGLALLSATSADPVVAGLLEMLEKANRETTFHARAGAEALVQAQDHHKTEMLGLMKDIEVLKDEHHNLCREIEHSLGSTVREREATIRRLQSELDFARLEIRRLQGPLPEEFDMVATPTADPEEEVAFEEFETSLHNWWTDLWAGDPGSVTLALESTTLEFSIDIGVVEALRSLWQAGEFFNSYARFSSPLTIYAAVGGYTYSFQPAQADHIVRLIAPEAS